MLFSLAIAVGLTPQLLPAIVTVSLATGARRLAKRSVVVKRLVSIEDLGNIEVLFTDKTGTLTEGRVAFEQALDPAGRSELGVLTLGLVANEATLENGTVIGGNDLDRALWEAPDARTGADGWRRVAEAPFDHERQLGSALADGPTGRLLVAKGAPEAILARCAEIPEELHGRPTISSASRLPRNATSGCAASCASPTRRRRTLHRRSSGWRS